MTDPYSYRKAAFMTDTSFRWQIDAYGHQNLQRVQAPIPQPGPGQIVVRVEAASLNYRDLMLTGNDKDYGWTPPLPFVPASDLAGTVSAVGAGVTQWKEGDRVINTFRGGWLDGLAPADVIPMGGPGPGALASHVLLEAQWVVAAPASLNAAQASTLPCAALTAWFALVEEGHLHAGQTVLIHGTGGVALFGLQFARMHGARAIVISGAEDKRAKALALGANHVLSRHDDWIAQVRELTGGRGVEQVLETVGGRQPGPLHQGGGAGRPSKRDRRAGRQRVQRFRLCRHRQPGDDQGHRGGTSTGAARHGARRRCECAATRHRRRIRRR